MADFNKANRKQFSIEGVGDFVLRRPSPFDRTMIYKQIVAMVGSVTPAQRALDEECIIAEIIATVNVTCENLPKDFTWSMAYEDWNWAEFWKEYTEWLNSFRPETRFDAPDDQGAGEGGSPDLPVPVPADLQPSSQ